MSNTLSSQPEVNNNIHSLSELFPSGGNHGDTNFSPNMNAYQLPFNAGSTATASPFNYFNSQPGHSPYGVLSSSYGSKFSSPFLPLFSQFLCEFFKLTLVFEQFLILVQTCTLIITIILREKVLDRRRPLPHHLDRYRHRVLQVLLQQPPLQLHHLLHMPRHM